MYKMWWDLRFSSPNYDTKPFASFSSRCSGNKAALYRGLYAWRHAYKMLYLYVWQMIIEYRENSLQSCIRRYEIPRQTLLHHVLLRDNNLWTKTNGPSNLFYCRTHNENPCEGVPRHFPPLNEGWPQTSQTDKQRMLRVGDITKQSVAGSFWLYNESNLPIWNFSCIAYCLMYSSYIWLGKFCIISEFIYMCNITRAKTSLPVWFLNTGFKSGSTGCNQLFFSAWKSCGNSTRKRYTFVFAKVFSADPETPRGRKKPELCILMRAFSLHYIEPLKWIFYFSLPATINFILLQENGN